MRAAALRHGIADIGPRSYGQRRRRFCSLLSREIHTLTPLITIVDDDSLVRRAVLRLVKPVGVEVHGFASAEEFLQAHSSSDPDCLVLDVGLPGMSGLELQRRLIETGRTPPIIFVTARDAAEVRDQALQAGAFAFLAKPFSDEVLLQAIRTILQPDVPGTRAANGSDWP